MRAFAFPLAALLATSACAGDEPAEIQVRWRHTRDRPVAPPALGPEDRVIVFERENPAQFQIIDSTGFELEGPYDTFPTLHAPAVVGTNIYIVTSIGRIVHTDLAGQDLAAPDVMLGATAPIVAAADGTLRVAATSGRLIAFDDAGTILFDVNVGGATDTAPAVSEDGVTYVATDTGSLVGYDIAGDKVFDETLVGQGSGPSARGQTVAVGDADGVKAFSANGEVIFDHPRAARVTGTRILANGDILAWGEDGAVELLDASGAVKSSYVAGPPIYVPVIEIDEDFAVIDDDGIAHRVGRDGVGRATFDLGGKAGRHLVVGETIAYVMVAVGNEVLAVDFFFGG
ncbi:MAG: PQQ-binding-like beta-propeller repeat protein [Deltaproteobacteria bacterium]